VSTAPSSFPSPPLADAAGEALVSAAFFGDDDRAARAEPAPLGRCDQAALQAAYAELAPRVFRFQRDLLGDAALATDATQETFIRAFRRVDNVPPETRLAAWVFGIAHRVSLEFRKARGRSRRVVVPAENPSAIAAPDWGARTPEAELLDREALRVVQRALERLPAERRAALLLRLDHGLSYEEIAQATGWSLAKVKVEIFRAREVLRATLEEYRGGGP
jgi:RNA polymerase sigma-70 factor (ECF subfamily)